MTPTIRLTVHILTSTPEPNKKFCARPIGLRHSTTKYATFHSPPRSVQKQTAFLRALTLAMTPGIDRVLEIIGKIGKCLQPHSTRRKPMTQRFCFKNVNAVCSSALHCRFAAMPTRHAHCSSTHSPKSTRHVATFTQSRDTPQLDQSHALLSYSSTNMFFLLALKRTSITYSIKTGQCPESAFSIPQSSLFAVT